MTVHRAALMFAVTVLAVPLLTLRAGARQGTASAPARPSPAIGQAGSADWPLHNLDLRNSRYSALARINTTNVSTLVQKWSFEATESILQMTPLVVSGTMYLNAGSKVYAVNGATGRTLWTLDLEPKFAGRQRGPAYGDGILYVYGPSMMYAIDAKTGKPVGSFGANGALPIVREALRYKYPGKYAQDLDTTAIGYSMTNPPTYYNGTLYVGVPFSDSHVPGGLLIAADAKTGTIKWVFTTIPQGPADSGWDIAKDTWGSGAKVGGGVWTTPAIDPELGLLYFNSTNPSPAFDGSARHGSNLFTNSVIALHLDTGLLAWYYQGLHHDLWDWDLATGPILFDVVAGGKTIKGIAAPGKTCYLYLWNRETGRPLNPMVETPVPTTTDVPGEQVSPTQPIPYTSRSVPQTPFCMVYPNVTNPELAKLVKPTFYPYQVNEFVITSPGNQGGSNYGGPSFSPRTGLMYVTGKNDAFSIKVRPMGDAGRAGPGARAMFSNIGGRGETGVTLSTTVAAYEPASGQQVWYTELPKLTNGGNVATAGDLVFQGTGGGQLHALDARSGKVLFTFDVKAPVSASPLTYQTGGTQYVSVVAGKTVFTLALP